jgi:hypothetical protein
MDCITREMSKSAVGYVKYILTSQILTPEDIRRRNRLVKILSGDILGTEVLD